MHLVSDWSLLHPPSFARTLLKMCNEPRTIDFQAQGLTGGEQHRNIFFFTLRFFLSICSTCVSCFFHASFIPTSYTVSFFFLFLLPQSYRWKTTIVLVSFYALFYSVSSKPSPNASCTSLFLSFFFFPFFYFFSLPFSFFFFFFLFFIFIHVDAQAILYTLGLLETIELHEWKLNRNARRRS